MKSSAKEMILKHYPKLIRAIKDHRTWVFYVDIDSHKAVKNIPLFSSVLSPVLSGFVGVGGSINVEKIHPLGLPSVKVNW